MDIEMTADDLSLGDIIRVTGDRWYKYQEHRFWVMEKTEEKLIYPLISGEVKNIYIGLVQMDRKDGLFIKVNDIINKNLRFVRCRALLIEKVYPTTRRMIRA